MNKKNHFPALMIMMAIAALSSCSWNIGRGDLRERNIRSAMLERLDSIPGVEFIGLADTRESDDGNFQAVIIFTVPDSGENTIERNARVRTNGDGSEIYSWEDLDCRILDEVKHKVTDKLEEKGIKIDGSLIDAIIELKRK